jgi:hypothetical protein
MYQTCRRAVLAVVFLLASSVSALAQSIPAIEEICPGAVSSNPGLAAQRDALVAARAALHARVTAHNQACPNEMPESLPVYPECMQEKAQLQAAIHSHIADTEAFNRLSKSSCVAAPAPEAARVYTPAGNGLILGTGAIVYAHREKGEPEQRMCDAIHHQSVVAHKDYDASVDCSHYQFVLGMASSLDEFTDLTNRVTFDDLASGKFTADTQILYDKLRGKQFDELGCHSNGAMICLAALENNDVKATNVILYGPQVTRESLAMWDQLVRDGRVTSVKVFVNEGDIVPGVSIAYKDSKDIQRPSGMNPPVKSSDSGVTTADVVATGAALAYNEPLFEIDQLKRTINESAPRIEVQSFPCTFDLNDPVKCHVMSMYRSTTGCTGKSSGRLVPGTHLPGQHDDLPEPPLPCSEIGR